MKYVMMRNGEPTIAFVFTEADRVRGREAVRRIRALRERLWAQGKLKGLDIGELIGRPSHGSGRR